MGQQTFASTVKIHLKNNSERVKLATALTEKYLHTILLNYCNLKFLTVRFRSQQVRAISNLFVQRPSPQPPIPNST